MFFDIGVDVLVEGSKDNYRGTGSKCGVMIECDVLINRSLVP